ncbi:MAG TPA: helicase-related protein [bacterium]|nr:helicase-related protein [bacterium]
MNNFITNSDTKILKDRLNELILKSEELKFLVGFFYFSGIRELFESIQKNSNVTLKILVGLNVDKTSYGLIEYPENAPLSDEEKINNFFDSIKKSINTTDFDKKDFYEQARFFIQLVEEGRLIIRKTVDPNHAKLYLFKLNPTQVSRRNLFITGSSNLTRSGLVEQSEFNVEISDYGVDNAEKYFDDLWKGGNSIEITENPETRRKLIDVLKNETLIREITPFEAYVYVLKNYLDTFEKKEETTSLEELLIKLGYKSFKYQVDAVEQALAIIEQNKGVILADVVGLGKTIIACLIARELRKRGLVICPPGIIGDEKEEKSGWKWYIEQFGLYDWIVESVGKLDDPEFAKSINKLKGIEVVIVDEAHRFRNEDTKSYEQLKNICRNKIVILLTATPFNNRPADILSLLKLFIVPKKSVISLENNLVDRFRIFKSSFDKLGYIRKYYNSKDMEKREKAISYYNSMFGEGDVDLKKVKQRTGYIAKQIKSVIEPVTIRRNRLDLQKNPYYKEEVKELTKVANPREWFFELTKEQSKFYDEVITKYFTYPEDNGLFKGAIYRPFEYKIDRKQIEKLSEEDNRRYQQQRNLYDFMRRLLVKRFESSFGAFRQSIENFKNVTEHCEKFIGKTNKFILDRSLLEKIYQLELDEIEKYLMEYAEKIKDGVYPKNHEIYEVDEFKYKSEFLSDIENDKRLFGSILEDLDKLKLVENDPKFKRLSNELKAHFKNEPERKIVIFSEYIDTIEYLENHLKPYFNNRILVIKGSLNRYKIDEINENFDASYPKEKQKNNYDILLSTDRISEGFNLNRAGMVINYDIPWNPVRVIQRVGRINRISKKVFDEIYIVNFFPTEKGADLVKSRDIAATKMFLIHNTLGEDSKIFDIDEEPIPSELYKKIQQNPDEIESESFYTKVLNEYEDIKKQFPGIIERIEDFSPRVKVSKKFNEGELLVFIKKNKRFFTQRIRYNQEKIEPETVVIEDIIERIKTTQEEPSLPLSDKFWDAYEKIKTYKEESMSIPEQSLEKKALHNVKTLLHIENENLTPLRNFLNMIRKDILDYGTLSDYTLRRIANLEIFDKNRNLDEEKLKKTIEEVKIIKEELGEDYLIKEKLKLQQLHKEIIIAIENREK